MLRVVGSVAESKLVVVLSAEFRSAFSIQSRRASRRTTAEGHVYIGPPRSPFTQLDSTRADAVSSRLVHGPLLLPTDTPGSSPRTVVRPPIPDSHPALVSPHLTRPPAFEAAFRILDELASASPSRDWERLEWEAGNAARSAPPPVTRHAPPSTVHLKRNLVVRAVDPRLTVGAPKKIQKSPRGGSISTLPTPALTRGSTDESEQEEDDADDADFAPRRKTTTGARFKRAKYNMEHRGAADSSKKKKTPRTGKPRGKIILPGEDVDALLEAGPLPPIVSPACADGRMPCPVDGCGQHHGPDLHLWRRHVVSHAPSSHVCECNAVFARKDSLRRHRESLTACSAKLQSAA